MYGSKNSPSPNQLFIAPHAALLKEKSPGRRAMLGRWIEVVVCDAPGLE
jgi:hypothetical protein